MVVSKVPHILIFFTYSPKVKGKAARILLLFMSFCHGPAKVGGSTALDAGTLSGYPEVSIPLGASFSSFEISGI